MQRGPFRSVFESHSEVLSVKHGHNFARTLYSTLVRSARDRKSSREFGWRLRPRDTRYEIRRLARRDGRARAECELVASAAPPGTRTISSTSYMVLRSRNPTVQW